MVNTQKCEQNDSVPYVATYNLWVRVFLVVFAIFVFWLLVFARDSQGRWVVVAAWQQHGWLTRAGIVLTCFGIPGAVWEVFLVKVIFAVGCIRPRWWCGGNGVLF